jgi:lipoprotein signal peptidase
MQLINSIKSEWLKTRKSAASWLCLIGGLFIPLIFLIGFLYKNRNEGLLLRIALSFILGGAIGNLIDRIFYGKIGLAMRLIHSREKR